MKNGTILMIIGKDADLNALEQQLESIRTLPAQVAVVIAAAVPLYPYYAISMPPYGSPAITEEWQAELAALKDELKIKAAAISTLLDKHGVSGDVGIIATEATLIADAIAKRAMICDIALISDDLRKTDPLFHHAVHGVLFHSPIGVILNDPQAQALCTPQKIFVAWKPHLHAARALHQALPLLQCATEVIVATIDPVMTEFQDGEDPGVDAAKWLTHHGCTVTVRQYPSGGHEIGTCILAKAAECGADLIVMGSYGRSRTSELIFGGTTRTLISQTKQAVFLAH